jgi:hypothetical protein
MKKNIIITLILVISFIYNCSGLTIESISEDDYNSTHSKNTEPETKKKEDTYSNKVKELIRKKLLPKISQIQPIPYRR